MRHSGLPSGRPARDLVRWVCPVSHAPYSASDADTIRRMGRSQSRSGVVPGVAGVSDLTARKKRVRAGDAVFSVPPADSPECAVFASQALRTLGVHARAE